MAFGLCTAANAVKQYSDMLAINRFTESTNLIRDQISRVDKDIAACPSKDVDSMAQLKGCQEQARGEPCLDDTIKYPTR